MEINVFQKKMGEICVCTSTVQETNSLLSSLELAGSQEFQETI